MAITVSYHNISSVKTTASSKALSYTTIPSKGDYVVVIVALQANLSGITCSSDTAGNSFSLLQQANSNGASIAMFGAQINTAPTGTSYGMTITYGGSVTAQVWEVVYLKGNGVNYAGQGNAIGESASTYSFVSATAIGTFLIQAGDSNKAGYGTATTSGATTLDNTSTSGSGASSNIGLVVAYVSISPGVSYTVSFGSLASNYNGLCYAEFQEAGAVDTTPPANVTNLSGTHTYNSVTLTWTNPTDSDFNHTNVYRNGTLLVNNSTATSYSDSGLNSATGYTYNITSVDTTGNESTGTSIVVTTDNAPDTTPPANVTGLTETNTDTTVNITWTNPTDSDFNHCNVYRGGAKIGQSTNGAYADSGLTQLTSYTYNVTSVDNVGNESTGSSINVTTSATPDTTPPAVPTGLTAIAGNNQVTLSWNANTETDLSGYNLYKSTDGSSFSKYLTSLTGTSYTDTQVTNGSTYWYKLTAIDTSNNESAQSSSVSATPQATADTTPPANVTGLSESSTNTTITLNWTNPSDIDFNHCNIYRDGTKVGQTSSTSFTDMDLLGATNYSYKVTSVDNTGNESSGNTVSAITTSVPPHILSLTESKIKISAMSGNNISLIHFSFDEDSNAYNIAINGTSYNSGTLIASGNAQTVSQLSGNTVNIVSGNTVQSYILLTSGSTVSIAINNTEIPSGAEGNYRVNIYGKSKTDGTWTPYNG